MQLNPTTERNTKTFQLPLQVGTDEDGVCEVTGRVLGVAEVDPIYGADAGARLAMVYLEDQNGKNQIVPLCLSKDQAPTLAAGQRVHAWGVHEPLTAKLPDCTLQMGVLSALDVHPI